MNKNKEFTTAEKAEKQIIRTSGFDPNETGIACYWGPNQKVKEEGERYEPPTKWKEEFLRVPKVVRFIYDEFEFKITPLEPGPWQQAQGPIPSDTPGGRIMIVYRRLSIHGDLYEFRPAFIPNDTIFAEWNLEPTPDQDAILGIRISDPQPPFSNPTAYFNWAMIYPVFNVFPNLWIIH